MVCMNLTTLVQMCSEVTFGEAVFGKLRVHAHHVDRSCEKAAKHLIRVNFPPVLGILQVMLFDVRPYLLDYLHRLQ